MGSRKILGVPPHEYCRPLIYQLTMGGAYEVSVGPSPILASRLRRRDLAAALLGPLDFAREGSEFRIVPEIGVSSSGSSNAVVLHFKEGLHTIATLAADPAAASEIVLATILLAEEFDVSPSIVPVEGDRDKMLRKADAALLVGDMASTEAAVAGHTLDLVEAWDELTDRPFVHGIWCCLADGLSQSDVLALKRARNEGAEDAARRIGSGETRGAHAFSYELDQRSVEGLQEYLHYAYYHGIIPDIPDLQFYSGPDREDPPAADPSLN
jgi:chorismate dehydratase